jgi:hypothetical protein
MAVLGGPLPDGGRPEHAGIVIDLDTAVAIAKVDAHLPPTGMVDGRPGKPSSHRYFLVPLASIPEWAHSRERRRASPGTTRPQWQGQGPGWPAIP